MKKGGSKKSKKKKSLNAQGQKYKAEFKGRIKIVEWNININIYKIEPRIN